MKKNNTDRYATIRFRVRKALGISCSEYAYCEIIYHLSNNPGTKVRGWANAKNSFYADEIGVTDRGLIKMKNRMVEQGLIERKDKNSTLIRTTQKWYDYAIEGMNKVQGKYEQSSPQGMNKVHPKYEQSSGQSMNKVQGKYEQSSDRTDKDIDNNKDNNSDKHKKGAPQRELKCQEDVKDAIAQTRLSSDTVTNRRKVFNIAAPYLQTDDFRENWEFWNDKNLVTNLDPEEIIKEWILKSNWHDVKNFNLHKITGWIQFAKKNKNHDQKSKPRLLVSEDTAKRVLNKRMSKSS